jgi:hypothetical protein
LVGQNSCTRTRTHGCTCVKPMSIPYPCNTLCADGIECIMFRWCRLHVVCGQRMGFVHIAFGWHVNVHRIWMVDGGHILFGWHGCVSQSDGMGACRSRMAWGCVERSGAGDVPITPSTQTSTASCTWHTVCVDALRPASLTVILGERHKSCLAHPVCSLQGAGLLPHPHNLLCLLVHYMHGSIDLGSC